ncbi:ubiquitin-conjugating enzyme E2 [Aspergillus saccharolyticus JOP 1030-1]|uniref:Ubiquitin-conjugating enzyme E2 Z n=1 Tax=Aspergillus saccharolyticus JOP 1030-1 TaxID=1450539 RepID=A0A318ZMV0_9EURO|nr:ubiquitin-conjugating enzyme [Aspergillus saccharolyticus JOP 1030-1]PYH48005.1 ubiquitin-conjugating enzyme [Aspergillus saccharolyticus JOP 1030-1]
MANQAILRLTREIRQFQQGTDLSLAVHYEDSDIRNVNALILGPPDTPYQFGFFEFSIKFGKDYPTNPPQVLAMTTNGGRCRFNPNIYATGKVCFTWRGTRGEQWSSAQGLESILISIQSLMSSNPYENEPGYADATSEHDKRNSEQYTAKIRHETLRLAVIEPLEASLGITPASEANASLSDNEERELLEDDKPSPVPFVDLRKRRFMWYFDSYMQSIDAAMLETPGKQKFTRMPFEQSNNAMNGHFDYAELKQRLTAIKARIIEETSSWAAEGLVAKEQELGIAVSLQRQYEQILESIKNQKNFAIDLNLVNENPFLWKLTYFGKPMTHLDGGIFEIDIFLSPKFPEVQPRVSLKTSFFHVRVSQDGVLCYIPHRSEEMRYHIEGIVAALEEENPPYDPRTTVNPEAFRLFWGTPENRKRYSRQLRRSVEKTLE